MNKCLNVSNEVKMIILGIIFSDLLIIFHVNYLLNYDIVNFAQRLSVETLSFKLLNHVEHKPDRCIRCFITLLQQKSVFEKID